MPCTGRSSARSCAIWVWPASARCSQSSSRITTMIARTGAWQWRVRYTASQSGMVRSSPGRSWAGSTMRMLAPRELRWSFAVLQQQPELDPGADPPRSGWEAEPKLSHPTVRLEISSVIRAGAPSLTQRERCAGPGREDDRVGWPAPKDTARRLSELKRNPARFRLMRCPEDREDREVWTGRWIGRESNPHSFRYGFTVSRRAPEY